MWMRRAAIKNIQGTPQIQTLWSLTIAMVSDPPINKGIATLHRKYLCVKIRTMWKLGGGSAASCGNKQSRNWCRHRPRGDSACVHQGAPCICSHIGGRCFGTMWRDIQKSSVRFTNAKVPSLSYYILFGYIGAIKSMTDCFKMSASLKWPIVPSSFRVELTHPLSVYRTGSFVWLLYFDDSWRQV